MGTRATISVVDQNGDVCMNMYKQHDSGPEDFGRELNDFVSGCSLVGFNSGSKISEVANGMQCLAAQIVAYFKRCVGDIYLQPFDDCNEDMSGLDYYYVVKPRDPMEFEEVKVDDIESLVEGESKVDRAVVYCYTAGHKRILLKSKKGD